MESRKAQRHRTPPPAHEAVRAGYLIKGRAQAFRFGIEEEFFLSDADTLLPATRTPERLFEAITPAEGSAGREMLQNQVEIATSPCSSFDEARAQLLELRERAATAAASHGLAILACGTHPLGSWRNSIHTPRPRYAEIMDSLQIIGRRNLLCGLHVHVEVPQEIDRVRLMMRVVPYIPLLMALATSSPFWEREKTGLCGYRLAAYDELPRTGFPELFYSDAEYQDYVTALVRGGAAPNASHIWWAIRPSSKYPTLELRAPDSCTRMSDSLAIAALYRALIVYLCQDEAHNDDFDAVDRAIAVENKWRAQRYGIHATFVTRSGPVSVTQMLEKLLPRLWSSCPLAYAAEVANCQTILKTGTSADVQSSIFDRHSRYGVDFALRQTADWIRTTTVAEVSLQNKEVSPV